MSQTPLKYNRPMFAQCGVEFKYREATITGGTDLVAGQVVVLASGKYRAAVDADKATILTGYRILLQDAAVSGGDVTKPVGISGGVSKALIVGAGLTVDEALISLLENSNIAVVETTDAIQIAGEDA